MTKPTDDVRLLKRFNWMAGAARIYKKLRDCENDGADAADPYKKRKGTADTSSKTAGPCEIADLQNKQLHLEHKLQQLEGILPAMLELSKAQANVALHMQNLDDRQAKLSKDFDDRLREFRDTTKKTFWETELKHTELADAFKFFSEQTEESFCEFAGFKDDTEEHLTNFCRDSVMADVDLRARLEAVEADFLAHKADFPARPDAMRRK